MFSKLKSNYRLSNIIVRILFVLTYVFCNWQKNLQATYLVLQTMEASQSVALPQTVAVPMMLISSVLTALLFMLVLPMIVNLLLNSFRILNVPRAEYNLLVMLFFTIGFFACGVLNCVNFFTPILLTWGSVLFPFVVSLGCVIGFYKVTAKMYFNDVTRPYYFKNVALVYIIVAFIMGVVLS